MMNQFSLLLLLFALIGVFSCANPITPQGGPKDTTKPKTLSRTPQNESVNFTGNTITFEFDEYIKTDKLFQQVVISPPLETFPDITVRGKKLVLKFKEPLKPNTTYNINFGDAVLDITEGNVADSMHYVFSTGPVIDSLSLTGNVIEARSNKPKADVLVLVYDQLEDSIVYKSKPYYFAKTDANGNFVINNMKQGAYKVFALEDGNFNLIFDIPTESIGYLKDPITLEADSSTHLHLVMFQEAKLTDFSLLSYNTKTPGKVTLVYSDTVNSFTITNPEALSGTQVEYNLKKDSIIIWHTTCYDNKKPVYINSNDTKTDTLYLSRVSLQKDSLPFKKLSIINGLPNSIAPNQPITITFERPIQSIDKSRIVVLQDSVAIDVDSINQTGLRTLTVKHKWKQGSKYQVILKDSAVIDNFGLTNDSLSFIAQALKAADFGNLQITVDETTGANNFILLTYRDTELIKSESIKANTKLTLNYKALKPGNYNFQVIADMNTNGVWDTGDYLNHLQPEPVYVYPTVINLKPNWDMELIITPKF